MVILAHNYALAFVPTLCTGKIKDFMDCMHA